MRFHGVILSVVTFSVISCCLPAKAEVAVVSGGQVTLTTLSEIDQGCNSHGQVSVGLIEQPQGGRIDVRPTRAYPNFISYNTRSRCNTRKLPATLVTYRASPGFTGSDNVTIEAVFPSGGVRRYRFAISVR